jgi:hypothetical protein
VNNMKTLAGMTNEKHTWRIDSINRCRDTISQPPPLSYRPSHTHTFCATLCATSGLPRDVHLSLHWDLTSDSGCPSQTPVSPLCKLLQVYLCIQYCQPLYLVLCIRRF